MKKRNKSLSKRLLASSLALAMCASMVCTTAFAAEPDPVEDYVYVYINVTEGEISQGDAPTKPNIQAPDGQIIKDVEDAKSELEAAKEGEGDNKTAPVFDADGALTGAVDAALDNLEAAQKDIAEAAPKTPAETPEIPETPETPEIPETPETTEPAPAADEGEDGESETPVTPEPEKSFADQVNDRVEALETAKTETERQVADALEAAKSALDKAKEDLTSQFNTDREKLQGELTAAANAAQASNDAVTAFETEQANTIKALEAEKAALEYKEPKAPVLAEGGDYTAYQAEYDKYVADYANYKKEVSDFEKKLADTKADLEKKAGELKTAADNAKKTVEAAKGSLNTFNSKTLDEYVADYVKLHETDDAVKAYNDAVTAYENATTTYNNLISGQDEASKPFSEAVSDYNTAANAFNQDVGVVNPDGTYTRTEQGTTCQRQ